jgi:hypothetical protein
MGMIPGPNKTTILGGTETVVDIPILTFCKVLGQSYRVETQYSNRTFCFDGQTFPVRPRPGNIQCES